MLYHVYILTCADGTLYTGITNDPESRVAAHNSGKGAKYTSGRTPVALAYQELHESKSAALRREIEVKKMTRAEKLQLIAHGGGTIVQRAVVQCATCGRDCHVELTQLYGDDHYVCDTCLISR